MRSGFPPISHENARSRRNVVMFCHALLNKSDGDFELRFDPSKPDEVQKAKKISPISLNAAMPFSCSKGGQFSASANSTSPKTSKSSAARQPSKSQWQLCALCLHPIGYYRDTWTGVMCPTDEVIAHLLMMHSSEETFRANANQHTLDHPAAGV